MTGKEKLEIRQGCDKERQNILTLIAGISLQNLKVSMPILIYVPCIVHCNKNYYI